MTASSTLARSLPRLAGILVLALVVATGCSRFKDKDADEGQPVEALYEKAHKSMVNENWSGAETTFKRLVAQYPYGPYTEQALMEIAYAQYKAGKHEDAISSIDRFLRTYPTHRNAAYLYYLRGLTNSSRDAVFLQRVWRLDSSRRDLSTPRQAYNDFQLVVDRYPNSRYAAAAEEKMAELRDTFARHQMDVALYYLRRTAYVAAANRATYLMKTYPDSMYQNDAIATLALAYEGMGNDALAENARKELQAKEPDHPYLAGKNWPDYPSDWRKLNPFAGEKSALDNM
ncbi:outer membrane protein assembly factor BamD [Marilutibacter aestuarii]|uniref:Outer membrane protein assembly factor BamD n=1 Tax=Marilutibacter aestuarii TaxID=1706195 RepID=A0A508AMD9_9GAMM|nr:outer membrane protein assembly factor BamD [Lysobacter aestuarii]TQD49654.1 outer membrane protein assembly factor BamD [Lysobacter aestuarii]